MILIGAPRIVSGNETTEPTPLTAVWPTSLALVISRYSPGENAAQLGRDGGELSEFVVVRGIGRLEVRKVDDRRAQRGELGDIGVVADPRDAARDGSGQKQRSIIGGEDDVERLSRLAEAAHLRFEHVDVDIGRREIDVADLVRCD